MVNVRFGKKQVFTISSSQRCNGCTAKLKCLLEAQPKMMNVRFSETLFSWYPRTGVAVARQLFKVL